MTVIGVDDTDSRTAGMCTTYVASRIADSIRDGGGTVERILLVRLNPAVEYKTRGNAALAIHTDVDAEMALAIGREALDLAETGDERTNPGLVVADCGPDEIAEIAEIAEEIVDFSRKAVTELCTRAEAIERCEAAGFQWDGRGNLRGVIGALAAVGAWRAFDDWTFEFLSYREPSRWGTAREVSRESVFRAAEAAYPVVWDTVDRVEDVAVCVPRTPCPILHGIRGDDPAAVQEVARAIESEPVHDSLLVWTNQGTDSHLQEGTPATVRAGRSYRLTATVTAPPETREGGHVFFELGHETRVPADNEVDTRADGGKDSTATSLSAVAFEPTKRFRDHVRALRVGDRITVCGEVQSGTVKLEKFAVRDLVATESRPPTCGDCGRSMKSAGRNAGYRCRRCGTHRSEPVTVSLDRDIEPGWYEVPPCARRHIAKPLIRGGFDAPVHPER